MRNLVMTALLAVSFLSSCNSQNKAHKDLEEGVYAEFSTDKGTILIKLHYDKVPVTVANFVALAEGNMKNEVKGEGVPFYDGLKFHRVITKANGDAQDFMIQGGDPQGTGAGGPGYAFPDEFDASLKHDVPGILSMANSGPGTNGSQFFITVAATPWLDNKHSIFGKVIKGMDVVNTIKKDDVMNTVTIVRIGKEGKKFDAVAIFAEAKVKADKDAAAAKEAAVAKQKEDEAKLGSLTEGFEKTPSGMFYKITGTKNGTESPVAGKKVKVHYTGTLIDGTKFDSSVDRGEPIEFPIGQGAVIKGWDEGIGYLKVGDKATLIIPPTLGYGAQARGPIPANSWMIFDVELISVAK